MTLVLCKTGVIQVMLSSKMVNEPNMADFRTTMVRFHTTHQSLAVHRWGRGADFQNDRAKKKGFHFPNSG